LNAYVYVRVSSKEQIENFSLETQEEQCRRYCDRMGFKVERVFVEGGKPGGTLTRPELQELLKLCEQNRRRIKAVVFFAVDRASRDTFDFLAVWNKLKKWDIALLSATQHIEDTPEGRFSATLEI
jgi:site-specific DNA recombinase